MSGRPRLGFIGLGLMGAPMARRLIARGWEVTAWNREPERYVEVPGARVADNPAAVRTASDLVLMCVLDATAVEACCFGEHGLAKAESGASLLVDTSTINPDRTREFAERLRREARMRWIDAPLSGGPEPAALGELTIMVGGDLLDIAEARPVLSDLAGNLTHLGPLGAGQTAKIVNQAIVGTSYLLMAEALALAEAAGLDAAKLPQALAGGLADSQALQRIFPQMSMRAYEPPKAYARQLDKDLRNVVGFIRDSGLDLPVIQQAAERYHAYVAQGNGMQDSTSVARLYERP